MMKVIHALCLIVNLSLLKTPSQGSTTAGKNQLAAETEMVDFNNVPLDWVSVHMICSNGC